MMNSNNKKTDLSAQSDILDYICDMNAGLQNLCKGCGLEALAQVYALAGDIAASQSESGKPDISRHAG